MAQDFNTLMKHDKFTVTACDHTLAIRRKASTLLIACIDFRLRTETEIFMREDLKLSDDYDEIAVPGASLSLENEQYPHWSKTVEDIISMAHSLHHIERIILLDHRDCGAYKLMFGEKYNTNRELETDIHKKIMARAKIAIQTKFPQLDGYTLIIGLDGVVENFQ